MKNDRKLFLDRKRAEATDVSSLKENFFTPWSFGGPSPRGGKDRQV